MATSAPPRRGRILVIPLVVLIAAVVFWTLVNGQTTTSFFDSSAYVEAANKPWSSAQAFYPKPLMVPLIYRWLGTDPRTIVWFQEWFAFISWAAIGIVLATSLRTVRARILSAVVAASFVLAPFRVGYAAGILSESINDSLMALSLAAAIALCTLSSRVPATRRQRIVHTSLQIILCGLLTGWMFARDSNAVLVLCGVCAANLGWGRPRWAQRWRLAGSVLVAGVAMVVLWSTSVIPPATQFTVQAGWPPELTARGAYSSLNNVFDRVLPDPEARAFFEQHGLPGAQQLAQVEDRFQIVSEPRYAEARRWIAAHARGLFVRWLLAHPIDRLTDQVTYAWTLFGIDKDQSLYMPEHGWVAGKPRVRRLLGITSSKPVIVALLLMFPVFVWRMRHQPVVQLALGLVICGWLGSLAAFYADTSEPGRHCFGSGQQVLFGLFLAALAALEGGSGGLERGPKLARTPSSRQVE